MRDECPNCGAELQAIDDRGTRIACTECPWMKTPYFEGLPIGSSDDSFKGKETTEDVPEKAEQPIQFDVPEVVEADISVTELKALKELLRFDGRRKVDIAEDLGINIGSVSAAAGHYEYYRRNGHFEGPELPFDGDISNYDPNRKRKPSKPQPGSLRGQAKSLALENPEMTYQDICESVGYENTYDAIDAVKEVDGGYKFERFSDLRKEILTSLVNSEDIDSKDLAERYGVDRNVVHSDIGNATKWWLDDVEVPGTSTEMEMETEVESELETEVEPEVERQFEPPIETEIEFEPEVRRSQSNGTVRIEMDKDVLVDIIIEGEITDENRRKIVEQLVS